MQPLNRLNSWLALEQLHQPAALHFEANLIVVAIIKLDHLNYRVVGRRSFQALRACFPPWLKQIFWAILLARAPFQPRWSVFCLALRMVCLGSALGETFFAGFVPAECFS